MRKLASIRVIEEVAPIPNADNIEKVRIGGWWCVARKSEFKTGDKCIYFEIDSLLPPIEQFSFLENKGRKKSIIDDKEYIGYRLKTIRLRGQISQGLALPTSIFKQFDKLPDPEVGTDLTDAIGVVKYEPPVPACISGEVIGVFPGFLHKTDEERIQNLNVADFQGKHFYLTEKVDGTSASIYKMDNFFGVCGRTMNFKETEKNTFWKIANQYSLKEKLQEGFAIQGEVAGEGIGGSAGNNPLKLTGQKLFVFYVYDINKAEYLTLENMELFCKELGLTTVPIIDRDFIINHTMDELLNLANRKSIINPKVGLEGIVFRLRDNTQKISFKIISNSYLLGEKD